MRNIKQAAGIRQRKIKAVMSWLLSLIVLAVTAYMLADIVYGLYDIFKNWGEYHKENGYED